ncbi:MAG: AMP-binding protein [Chloroflexi bacterium]|nr:AMP-binding protein [Chloroflexota bacterium]
MLAHTARRLGSKAAIILGEQTITYAELAGTSNKVANALLQAGLRKGDRVGLLLNNSLELVSLFLGTIKAGGIAVGLDTRYRLDELDSVLGSCRPRFLTAESPTLEYILPALARFPYVEQIISLDPGYRGRGLIYEDVIRASSAAEPGVALSEDDIATITYTSGPSTHPHGAMFSHRCLSAEAACSAAGFAQTERDIVMLYALPLHHMFGQTTVLLTCLYQGSTIVMVPGTGISINTLMESIEKHRGTILLGVPYIFALAIKMAKREGIKHDLSSLRFCGSGGAPLPVETILEFKRHFGMALGDLWGLTEAVSQVTCQPPDGSGKIGSCGIVLPGWQVKIVDGAGNELAVNQPGEILVKGHFTRGYYNDPEATAKVITDGWLHTGDLGRIDEDGYVYITGRKKRMIILKGQNIYPDDVETVIKTHPKVADVRVTGLPDELRGEIVKAVIYLKPGEECEEAEIRRFCYERMADYKTPKIMVFEKSA